MSKSLFDIAEIKNHLEAGELVITPNRRIRAKMLDAYAQSKVEEGKSTWDTPSVFSLEAWVQKEYEAAVFSNFSVSLGHSLLTEDQEVSLWENVIQNSSADAGILNFRSAAQLASKAFKTMCLWQESLDEVAFNETVATASFATWMQQFEGVCSAMGVVPSARVPGAVLDAYASGILKAKKTVLLVGFDDIPPVYRSIFEIAADSVTTQDVKPVSGGKACLVEAFEESDEVKLAATWAQNIVSKEPGASIGVIVPDLGQRREEVRRIFSSVLDPYHLLPHVNRHAPVFNMSAGEALRVQPLVDVAFDVLSLNKAEIQSKAVRNILFTPLIGGGVSESVRRSKLWFSLNELKQTKIKVGEFVGATKELAQLGRYVARAQKVIADPAGLKYPSEWSQLFGLQLEAAGWPGERQLNSVEYQTVKAFHRVLHELAGYDPVTDKMPLGSAIGILLRLAANTHFQPETEDSPVQVLGALEGAGLNFDYVWVMGMRDDKWPASPSPSPFIPVSMQREKGMPNASPERELAFARSLTERFAAAGSQVIFSYPAADKEYEVVPCHLVSHLPLRDRADVASQFAVSDEFWVAASGRTLESRPDTSEGCGVQDEVVSGGTGLFRDYALCEFRGLMRNALKVRALSTPEDGVSRSVRGQINHLMMKNVWLHLESRTNLEALVAEPEKYDAFLQETARSTVDEWSFNGQGLYGKHRDLEVDRLELMAKAWLENDLARSDFVVIEMEREVESQIGPIRFIQKRDRVDRLLSSGRVVVSDYKENAPRLTHWNPDRLLEPQVPIGTVTLEGEQAAGALFAMLNRERSKYLGCVESEEIAPGVSDWGDGFRNQVIGWQRALTDLAERIACGGAVIDPAGESEACGTCELKSLCRRGLKTGADALQEAPTF